MSEEKFRYVLAGREGLLRGSIPEDVQVLAPSDKIVFVKSIAECLNAERNGVEAVIWNSEDFEQLEELSPKKSEYGWMLVSVNIPILFHITNVSQLEQLQKVDIQGFYSEDLNVLLESRKKLETLPSE